MQDECEAGEEVSETEDDVSCDADYRRRESSEEDL